MSLLTAPIGALVVAEDAHGQSVGITTYGPSDTPPPPPTKPYELPVRFSLAVGGHVVEPEASLAALTGQRGLGLHINTLVGPARWPLLAGLLIGGEGYSGPGHTFEWKGETGLYELQVHSYWVLGMVRIQPEGGILRPRLDLLAGMWGLDVGVGKRHFIDLEADSTSSLGGRVTGAYGLAIGADLVVHSFAVGLGVQFLACGGVTVPDISSARVVDEQIVLDQRQTGSIGQWMFMLDLGGASPAPKPRH